MHPDGKLLLAGDCRSGIFDNFCVARYDGGPFSAPGCSLDIDGDTQVLATTDSLIHARIDGEKSFFANVWFEASRSFYPMKAKVDHRRVPHERTESKHHETGLY